MSHHLIDIAAERHQFLVRIDGRIKLLLLFAALAVNLSSGGFRVSLVLAASALVLVTISGERPAAFLKRMIIPAVLASVALLTQLFWYRQGTVMMEFNVASHDFEIYRGGFERGVELGSRIVGGMGTLLFFSLTTPLPELMKAARFFRCPAVLVEVALIMYRYIFLLFEEGGKIRHAQKARLGFCGFRTSLRSSGILGGMLVLRTYDRAERSFAAMRCRGYRGVMTGPSPKAMQSGDWGALTVGMAGLAALFVFR